MKKFNYIFFIFITIFLVNNRASAQNTTYPYYFQITVYDVSLIRINPSSNFNLYLLSSLAGNSMDAVTNSSTYLQLTSIPPINQSRFITAIISAGDVPAGTMLTLYAVKGSGYGDVGVPSSTKTLNKNANQTIIDGISSGFTGTNLNEGFQLFYTLQVNPQTYSQLRATQSMGITVTYTISNNP